MNKKKNIKELLKRIKSNYPMYKNFKPKNIKLKIVKLVFRMNMAYAFVVVYSFFINKLKINIKW